MIDMQPHAFDLMEAVAAAQPHDIIHVPAGRYAVNLDIDKPLTLLAVGLVVFDGLHQGSVLRVQCNETVRVSGITFVGGHAAQAGGAIHVSEGALELSDCIFRFNEAPVFGGGALYVSDGSVLAQRCRFEGNTGRNGGAILLDGVSTLRLQDSMVVQNAAVTGGGICVIDGAHAEIRGCTIADNAALGPTAMGSALYCGGSTSRAPHVTVSHCVVSERKEGPLCIANAVLTPADLSISHSLLPLWCAQLEGPGNLFGPGGFVMKGVEPYSLAQGSLAASAADAATLGASPKDIIGRVRARAGRVDLGAFAFSDARSDLPYG
jgi:hypothetical protein